MICDEQFYTNTDFALISDRYLQIYCSYQTLDNMKAGPQLKS